MRRLTVIAAFALFLAVPLWAQHGGGHSDGHGGGSLGHGGFSGGHAGGGHVSGGMHSGMGSRGFTHVPSSRSGFSSRGAHRRGPAIRNFGFNNCFGCRRRYAYPWAYGGYYDPYWWWDSGSSYDEDYERDRASANEMNAQSLDEQRMRRQDDQDLYAQSAPPAPREEERAVAAPATVLVFRDQRRQEIQNYAIVGQTLWNFAPQRTEKIPLADLDLAATTKANDQRGVDFRVPAANEGQ